MKQKFNEIILTTMSILIVGLSSCYDEKMQWGDPYTHPESKDLPLELQEKISRYEALNTYVTYKLGVGIDFNLYLTDENYRNLVNLNFDEITPGNELKQSSLMKDDGTLDFSKADPVIDALREAGLTVYGHTLVWHSQQKASYLNSLIAPEIIPSSGESQLDVSALLDMSFTGWNRNNANGISVVEGMGLSNGPAIRFETTSAGNEWDTQLTSPDIPAVAGHAYRFSFWIKSDDAGQARISFSGMANNYPWVNGGALFNTSGAWTQITYDEIWDNTAGANVPFTATANVIKMSFDMGKVPGVYYVDIHSLSVIDLDAEPTLRAAHAGPVIIEKTPEEKKAILEPVFRQYITGVVTHYAGKVAAWDVVNEPMNDNGTLRTGEENLQSTSAFYWQYYLGKDYAVTAFKTAKAAADPDAKLFINDYNLESSGGSKLDGLIDYVKYIESQGAQVDGIGTQMHLNINWSDTAAIQTMFQKLAATGKLIKVSELDIAIANSSDPESPVSPTAEQYAQQAELYRFVAATYNQYIPEAQRYGITVWGVSDNAGEHEYWLKNDAPCLWNADYARKHAYKGLADGLAGKDVSIDFSGELR